MRSRIPSDVVRLIQPGDAEHITDSAARVVAAHVTRHGKASEYNGHPGHVTPADHDRIPVPVSLGPAIFYQVKQPGSHVLVPLENVASRVFPGPAECVKVVAEERAVKPVQIIERQNEMWLKGSQTYRLRHSFRYSSGGVPHRYRLAVISGGRSMQTSRS